jgi:hypothetical protein
VQIPDRFKYLDGTVRKYCIDAVQLEDPTGESFDRNQYLDTLSPRDISQIAGAFSEIERRNDSKELSRWIQDDPDHDPIRRRIFLLFVLFEALAERGIEPFTSRSVELQSESPKFDWSKLPRALGFLAEPAEKYGRYQFQADVDKLFEEMSSEEFVYLKHLAKVCAENKTAIVFVYRPPRAHFNPHPRPDDAIAV